MQHYSIVVYGRVQGVGYRAFVLQNANNLGISGFVKNKPEGTVQIEAEGEAEMLGQFVHICKIGPRWAHVESLVKSESPAEGYKGFTVKY